MSLLPSQPDTSAADPDAEPRVIGVDSDDADDVISALSSETARKLLAELHEEPAPPSKLADRVDTSLQNAQYHLEKLQTAGAVSVVDTAYSAKGREMDVYAPADEPLVIFAGDQEKSNGLKAALSRFIGGFGALAVGSLAIQQLYGSSGGQSNEPAATGGAGAPSGDGGVVWTTEPGGARETVAQPPETTPNEFSDVHTLTDQAAVTLDNGTAYFTSANGSEIELASNVTSITFDNGTRLSENASAITDRVVIEAAPNAPEAADTAASIEPGLAFFLGGLAVLSLWLGVWYVKNR